MPDRPTTKDARRDAARVKARQMRELEARRRRRNRVLAISAAVVVLVLAVGAVALVVTRTGGTASATPPQVTADGGVVLGQDSAPHTVTIFQDYQCPVCKAYEAAVGPWLSEQVDAGTTTLEYRPIAFLDSQSSTRYSTRGANAAFCAAGAEGVDFGAFNTAMYLEQPEEGGEGLTDSRLISIAQSAGADVGPCITDGTYEDYVAARTEAAFALTDDDGRRTVTGTPTVFVDGTLMTNESGQGAPTQEQLATALGVG